MQDPSYSSLLRLPEDEDDLITFEELRPAVKHTGFNQHYETTYYNSVDLENPCSSGLYHNESVNTPLSSDINDFQEVSTTVSTVSRKRKVFLKQNHSEIEKRRRDKMNTYITELSAMIPMCSNGSGISENNQRPSSFLYRNTLQTTVLTDQELKQLILQVAEGFVFVVGCDRGKILYISESVSKILYFSQNDLLRQSLFDILHPKDVAKVKEQLSSSDHNPKERFFSSKISRLCPGARRSFICRMKCHPSAQIKGKSNVTPDSSKNTEDQNIERKYTVIQCTGYLKSWSPTKIGLEEPENDIDAENYNVSCLIAVGRNLSQISTIQESLERGINTRPIQFISKHTLDGKFLYVDQRYV
ncbi:hypothetical protein HHI36_020178 [Cryptolaemus montrouzieri]|uniref:Aryl hydrocarbon receptor nuclear translocator-like protein 1 n=1 Tax=Cryptolaemus montrouzieri TaxID=559131 RepID=A0ABD2N9H0_9CUCU